MLQPHIRLDETIGTPYALLPGDPARIDSISSVLDNVKEIAFNREYRSITGEYKGRKILAMSTGMGGCSTGIAVEELTRIGVKAMIRIGSCGAMQTKIGLGDLILAVGAVRDDGASQAYIDLRYPALADIELLNACINSAKKNGFPYHIGLIHSHESFYIDDNEKQKCFWSQKGVLGADMETAALFTIGRLRGVKTASILNNVVTFQSDTAQSIAGYADGEKRTKQGEINEIVTALDAFALMSED